MVQAMLEEIRKASERRAITSFTVASRRSSLCLMDIRVSVQPTIQVQGQVQGSPSLHLCYSGLMHLALYFLCASFDGTRSAFAQVEHYHLPHEAPLVCAAVLALPRADPHY
jgi:hypothetical protein